jgi:large subunit ribosomal protein L4
MAKILVNCIVIVELPLNIFNVPIRRDIVNTVFRYERHSKFRRFKRVKTVGDVAGSGKKPHPQKHTGRARRGNIRSSLSYHGGKSFGSVPKDFKFPLNKKVRLLAMKSLLSARLMEGRIVVLNTLSLETHKTKELNSILKPFKNFSTLILTEKDVSKNVFMAAQNLPYVTALPSYVYLFKSLE